MLPFDFEGGEPINKGGNHPWRIDDPGMWETQIYNKKNGRSLLVLSDVFWLCCRMTGNFANIFLDTM